MVGLKQLHLFEDICQHPYKQAFYDLLTSQGKGLELSDPENPFCFLLSVFAMRVKDLAESPAEWLGLTG